ncbi:response regulator transcription factor [Yoonia sediminilitoris]|uniref:LuxR family two component transcriptional regulator n=1 Tax=Yoonia sediminilitoris TaxID=1286148 RepID=A0A2T6KPX8_9RHOB|nr:response regulator transcription factor [Yoonia sediminilitoris]PUB18612.1 LuxR family two component transcriptional regulator [Yoonia sediminilitoris]RCW98780.1 LuxR family two component transcriptional regulator [Yoonia sediminilitoris]
MGTKAGIRGFSQGALLSGYAKDRKFGNTAFNDAAALCKRVTHVRTFTCVIADDHAIVRAGLRAALTTPGLIEPGGIDVVAEAANGLEAIACLRQHRPHLLLLDVQMPFAGGTEVLLEARRWSVDTKIVVLTGISSVGKLSELIDAGVDGIFSKATENDELYATLPLILRGGRHVSQHVVDSLDSSPPAVSLTDRERQTLNLVVAGRSNKEIAETLGISAKTVDRHRTNMMQKIGVHSVAQLIAFALREGLIDGTDAL